MFPVRISSHLINTQQTNDRRWAKEVIKGKNHKVGSQRLRLDILRFKLHSERIRKRKRKKKNKKNDGGVLSTFTPLDLKNYEENDRCQRK